MADSLFEKTNPKPAFGRKYEARNTKSEIKVFEKTNPILFSPQIYLGVEKTKPISTPNTADKGARLEELFVATVN